MRPFPVSKFQKERLMSLSIPADALARLEMLAVAVTREFTGSERRGVVEAPASSCRGPVSPKAREFQPSTPNGSPPPRGD
jgi:hypothetical protein